VTEPAIEVNDLTVAYRENPVLWDVDLSVRAGALTAIVGPNERERRRSSRPFSGS
jgi:manganese/zinc/iron transport system ATP- binding protein